VPVTELQPGDPDRIGPYRVLSRLGSGGMGIVYLVQAGAGLGALKLIRPQLADDPEFRARFRREVEAGRAVAGPYTARYIDAEVEGPTPYLVTEYVDGPSLGEAVADGGPFGFEAVVGLASGLAEALQAIHAVGVIHRDLKPSNVILAEKFAERFDGFSIGSNDLTQLVLGVDRDSAELSELFDERDEAVTRMIRSLITSAHLAGRKVGICGQAPSDYPDFAEFLVSCGIDSISLNPDSVIKVIRHVAEAESRP